MHEVDFEPVPYVYDFSGKTFHVYDLTRLALILLFRHRTIKYPSPPLPSCKNVKNGFEFGADGNKKGNAAMSTQ